MGHLGRLGRLKDEYLALVRQLEGGQVALPEPRDPRAWQGWKDVLEILYTPEDAAFAAKLPTRPSSLERIAERVGVPAAELKPRLDGLCDRGLVLDLVHPETGATRYLLAPPVVGFVEFSMMRARDDIPKKRMAEALDAYTRGDDTFVREVFGGETVIGRTLVHETALDAEVEPRVLEWEQASAIVSEARARAVSICYCRHKAHHLGKACDAPQEICLSLNGGADFVTRRKFGRPIDRKEALDLMAAARERGLVQIADNVLDRPSWICNCCGCCCGQLQAINEFDLPAVRPSGFEPRCDGARCAGCARCARACPVGAITMAPERAEARRKNEIRPAVNEARCLGCGVCADACKRKAMRMVRRREQPKVPKNAVERALRMVIERGRLAQFLFDEGEGRGARFLGQVCRALLALPGAERALASEQVRSRFVRAALARVSPGLLG